LHFLSELLIGRLEREQRMHKQVTSEKPTHQQNARSKQNIATIPRRTSVSAAICSVRRIWASTIAIRPFSSAAVPKLSPAARVSGDT
jgi:hypothetical protein